MLKEIDAIIFDIDGTLIDSMWIWTDIDEIFLKKYNLTQPEGFHEGMEGKSYSYRTLETLSKKYPQYEFVLICGTDMFVTLLEWKYPDRIFKAAQIGGVFRAGGDFSAMEKLKQEYESLGASVGICYAQIADISSTAVRECISKGENASNLIDREVYDYIKMNNLYKD